MGHLYGGTAPWGVGLLGGGATAEATDAAAGMMSRMDAALVTLGWDGELAAAYQDAIVDVLVEKTVHAAQQENAQSVMLSGGVSANALLRRRMETRLRPLGIPLYIPEMQYCTDNAAMIAGAAYQVLRRGALGGWELDVRAQLPWASIPGIKIIERASG